MAELTIRLRIDPATGKKNVVLELKSDEDALPLEHEQTHRALVRQLIAAGALTEEELGRVVVERVNDAEEARAEAEAEAEAEAIARKTH